MFQEEEVRLFTRIRYLVSRIPLSPSPLVVRLGMAANLIPYGI